MVSGIVRQISVQFYPVEVQRGVPEFHSSVITDIKDHQSLSVPGGQLPNIMRYFWDFLGCSFQFIS